MAIRGKERKGITLIFPPRSLDVLEKIEGAINKHSTVVTLGTLMYQVLYSGVGDR